MKDLLAVDRIELVRAIAELATHFNRPSLRHDAADLLAPERPQNTPDALARTPAAKVDRSGLKESHVLFME